MNFEVKNIFFSIIFFLVIFSPSRFLRAESYDIYVNKSYSEDDSDGSSEKPYKTIEKALEHTDGGSKKIYVRNGEYSGNLVIPEKVSLFGQDKNKTIIKAEGLGTDSTTRAKGDNMFKNLSFSHGLVALTIEGKATVESCVIKNAAKKGINLSEDGASVTIKKSKITENGKGIYVQKGRNIDIYDNEISKNDEEGIDIREKVSGSVDGNSIFSNGEGGIELIVGNSNLKITGNSIRKNKASGIANQFYSQASKTGKIIISKNTISRNKNYGILCNAPGGSNGLSAESYWNDSLDLRDNNISSNGKKEISDSCELIEAISEEEKKTNTVLEGSSSSEDETSSGKSSLEDENQEKNSQGMDENFQNYEYKADELRKDLLKNKKEEIDNLISSVSQKKESLNENWLKIVFKGYDIQAILSAREENKKIKEQVSFLEEIKNQTESEEIKSSAEALIGEVNNIYSENEIFINKKENSFSFFGWLFRLFN